MQITISEAKEFLDGIIPKDKVAIIHHNDQDGYASAISISEYLKKIPNISFFETDLLTGVKPFVEKLNFFDKLIFLDLGQNIIIAELEILKNKEILYIDHHEKDSAIPENILEYRTPSYKSASLSVFLITRKKELLTFLGVIADCGWNYSENNNYINDELRKFKIDLDEAKKLGDDFGFVLKLYKEEQDKIIDILKKIEKPSDFANLEKLIKPMNEELNFFIEDFEKNKEKLGKVYFYYLEPKFCGKVAVVNQVSYSNMEKILIFASPKDDLISISARNQSGIIDCAKLLKKATESFENSNAGGHPKAAGGRIMKKDLEKFKENLREIII